MSGLVCPGARGRVRLDERRYGVEHQRLRNFDGLVVTLVEDLGNGLWLTDRHLTDDENRLLGPENDGQPSDYARNGCLIIQPETDLAMLSTKSRGLPRAPRGWR